MVLRGVLSIRSGRTSRRVEDARAAPTKQGQHRSLGSFDVVSQRKARILGTDTLEARDDSLVVLCSSGASSKRPARIIAPPIA
jgi:rhodanese-related sulfurtransferase